MSFLMQKRLGVILLCLLTVPLFSAMPTSASPPANGQLTVGSVEFLGLVTFDTGFRFANTEVGGLSGIAYDSRQDVYYALSDDRSQVNLARFYTVAIDLSDGLLEVGDVVFISVTTLLDARREPFAPGSADPEGIALPEPGRIYISSEGAANASPPLAPFVNRFNLNGKQNKVLPVPDTFLPDGSGTFGVRNNRGFESLAASPNRKSLYTATESALAQDGPVSGINQTSLSRILHYKLNPGRPEAEYVYVTSAIPFPPDPPSASADNGLVELVVLDNTGTLLALERSFAVGVGNTIKLFEVLTQDATDVSGLADLYDESMGIPADFDPAAKRLVVDLADLGIDPDNVEGMTFGPVLPDGRQTLILVSDNNFNPTQTTQFIALALTIDHVP